MPLSRFAPHLNGQSLFLPNSLPRFVSLNRLSHFSSLSHYQFAPLKDNLSFFSPVHDLHPSFSSGNHCFPPHPTTSICLPRVNISLLPPYPTISLCPAQPTISFFLLVPLPRFVPLNILSVFLLLTTQSLFY